MQNGEKEVFRRILFYVQMVFGMCAVCLYFDISFWIRINCSPYHEFVINSVFVSNFSVFSIALIQTHTNIVLGVLWCDVIGSVCCTHRMRTHFVIVVCEKRFYGKGLIPWDAVLCCGFFKHCQQLQLNSLEEWNIKNNGVLVSFGILSWSKNPHMVIQWNHQLSVSMNTNGK